VTLWDTIYLDRVVRHMCGSGVEVSGELLAHVVPLSVAAALSRKC